MLILLDSQGSGIKAVTVHSLFGPPSKSAVFHWEQYDVAVHHWGADRTAEGVELYITESGILHPAPHAVEFFTGLAPGRDEVAGTLAALHRYQQVHEVLLGHGHTVPSEQPLWTDTILDSVLVLRQAAVVIPPLFTADRHVEFMQVVPTTTAERESVHRLGVETLLADWEARQVPFWDSERA